MKLEELKNKLGSIVDSLESCNISIDEAVAELDKIFTPAPPPRSAEKRPIVIFGEPLRFKSLDERILDEIHNSEEPTIRSAEDLIRGAFGGCTCSEAYASRNKTDPYCFFCNHADDIKRIMHTYASQLRHEVTDEEIEKEAWKITYEYRDQEPFIDGAKWMREKMNGE